jgi:hypothetical protein
VTLPLSAIHGHRSVHDRTALKSFLGNAAGILVTLTESNSTDKAIT